MEQIPIFVKNIKKSNEIFKTVKIENNIDNLNKLEILSEKKEKKKYNDWNPEEDALLLRLCDSNFQKKWKKIALIIGNKTPRMCAYRIKKIHKRKKEIKEQGTRKYERNNHFSKNNERIIENRKKLKKFHNFVKKIIKFRLKKIAI